MTVTYSADVATSSLACFLRLLLRWRGSIYKLMWKEFLIFFCLYYFFGVLYQFVLTRNVTSKEIFEEIVLYCNTFSNSIPVSFILGFYINAVNSRWWSQFCAIAWPDRTAHYVAAYMPQASDRARLMRRTIVRYINLSITMTLAAVSPRVKKRFPTLGHLKEAGILLPNEEMILDNIKLPYNKFFIPLSWAMRLVTVCRKEGLIQDDFGLKTILDEITSVRSSLGMIFNYDWIPVPLVYTQVVTLAVYTFILSTLFGQQPLDNKHGLAEIYFPFFTFLQFFFYMGWLKVAEQMVNPFGEDDDDFEVNVLVDRNIKVAYLIADEMHAELPELFQDIHWDAVDFSLPYTKNTRHDSIIPAMFNGSANGVIVTPEAAVFVPLYEAEADIPEGDSVDSGTSKRTSITSQPPTKAASMSIELEEKKSISQQSTGRKRLSTILSRRNTNNSNIRRLECTSELNLRAGTRMSRAMNRHTDCREHQHPPHDFLPRRHQSQQHNQKALRILQSCGNGRDSDRGLSDEARVGLPLRRPVKSKSGFVEPNVTYV